MATTAQKLREQGWQTECEYKASAELTVDIHAEKDGRLLAVLVETGKSDIKRNIELVRNEGYAETWILATSPKARRAIGNRWEAGSGIGFIGPGGQFPIRRDTQHPPSSDGSDAS